MHEPTDKAHDAGDSRAARPLYPASIAFLIEERPLLWYEDPQEYDALIVTIFEQMSPVGALNCIFAKNVVDYLWDMRRMKKMKQAVINCAMPSAATKLLTGYPGDWDPERKRVEEGAAFAAYGAGDKPNHTAFNDRMHAKHVTSEMIHYSALGNVADRLHWISRECERLESRFHRLLADYEKRNATLAALAKGLVEREKAENVSFKEVN